jgi:hypothetical protein
VVLSSLRKDAWRIALAVWVFAFFAGMSASLSLTGPELAMRSVPSAADR